MSFPTSHRAPLRIQVPRLPVFSIVKQPRRLRRLIETQLRIVLVRAIRVRRQPRLGIRGLIVSILLREGMLCPDFVRRQGRAGEPVAGEVVGIFDEAVVPAFHEEPPDFGWELVAVLESGCLVGGLVGCFVE